MRRNGRDVEAIGLDPLRPSGDLEILHAIRELDQFLEWNVGRRKSPALDPRKLVGARPFFGPAAVIRFDG